MTLDSDGFMGLDYRFLKIENSYKFMHVWSLRNVGEHSDQLCETGVSQLNSGKSKPQGRLQKLSSDTDGNALPPHG